MGPVIAQYKVITCLCRVIWRQQISALSITKLGHSGLGRKLQVEAVAATSSRNLESWSWQDMGYPPNQLKGVIMVTTSGLARSNFGGRNVLCWKVQRVSIQNMYIVANVCINHFYIGWGTFVYQRFINITLSYWQWRSQLSSSEFTPICTSCIYISLRKDSRSQRSTCQRNTWRR